MEPIILYVDDERPNLDLFHRCFDERFEVRTAASGPEAIEMLEWGLDVGVLVSDQRMAPMSGIELLSQSETRWPLLTRMLLTAFSDRDLLLQAIQRGRVHDYVLKPWSEDDLAVRLAAAVEAYKRRRLQANAAIERDTRPAGNLEDEMVGGEGGLKQINEQISKVARAPSNVVIRGENGTGKEVVARAIHHRSPRANGPFVAVNCGALPDELIENELFGYEKGAHSTATQAREGRFEQADGGTLFLDEIGDLPLKGQVALLRVLETREVMRLGGAKPRKVNIRLLAATNQPLEEMVAAKTFREDLYHRLNVVRLDLPPLRERPNDIDALARHFLRVFNTTLPGRHLTISGDAIIALQAYDWPGNVRELRNAIERAAVMNEGEVVLEPQDFNFDMARVARVAKLSIPQQLDARDAERIRAALLKHRNNRTRAAIELDMKRTTLNDWIRRLNIQ